MPDALFYSVRPMLAVSKGRLICLSTPFGKRGFFLIDGCRETWGDNADRPGSFGGTFSGFKDKKVSLQGPIRGLRADELRIESARIEVT